jgi:hypothetical protein
MHTTRGTESKTNEGAAAPSSSLKKWIKRMSDKLQLVVVLLKLNLGLHSSLA